MIDVDYDTNYTIILLMNKITNIDTRVPEVNITSFQGQH